MRYFLLGVDGGGSKTLALLCDAQGKQLLQLTAGPAHLTNDLAGACQTVRQLVDHTLQQAQLNADQVILVVGIAGAGDDELKHQFTQKLQLARFACGYVTTDAKTSLYGANAGAPVVAIALGTGSVAMRLDQCQQEQQVGGWGFSIGDEGGGAAMGKAAVRAALWEIDSQPHTMSALAQAVFAVIGQSKTAMLTWLRQANANQYAAFAPTVIALAETCPAALKVLHKHAADVELLIKTTRADTDLPVVVLGGLAAATVPYLSPTVRDWCQPALADSVHGAIFIAQSLAATLNATAEPADVLVQHKSAHNSGVSVEPALNTLALAEQLSHLTTESRDPTRIDLATLDTPALLTRLNQADQQVPGVVSRVLPQVATLVDRVVAAFAQGGRLIYLGAGTSGRLGVLDAVECPPTFSISADQVVGVIAGGQSAMFRAKEGAEDDRQLAVDDLVALQLTSKDILVGIAASGRTPYVVAGLDYARQIGAFCAGISCNPDTDVLHHANLAICAEVGPEVLTGSTRLKAGTAQKLILNMISTAAMVRSGKVYQDLMVDLHASNAKLKARALNIIHQATGCSLAVADRLLQQAEQSVKLAILLFHYDATGEHLTPTLLQEARELLSKEHGYLHQAIGKVPC